MDDNAPILDYASPRKRLKLRLAARSTIAVRSDRDEIVVTESLKGQSGAVKAVVFACFTLLVLGVMAFQRDQHHKLIIWQQRLFLAGFAAVEIAVMLAVIHQTWRRTILTVRHNELLLFFISPFHRKEYRWVGDDIADMIILETANQETPAALCELLITRCRGGDIHLFTDHFTRDIRPLSETLTAMFRRGEAAPPAAVAVAEAPRPPLAKLPSREELATYRKPGR